MDGTVIADPVPRDAPGSHEIGFSIPESYNCSAVLYDNLAAGRAGKVAVYCADYEVTYGDLCAQADRVGNGLIATGLQRGDRVVLLLADTPAYLAAFFGAVRAGFVPVLINTQSPAELLRYYLSDSGAEVVICEAELAPVLGEAVSADSNVKQAIFTGGSPPDEFPLPTDAWDRWLAGQEAALAPADTRRDEMAFWMYSSGSTGRPKGIVHLQHDMAYTHLSYARNVLELGEEDVVFSVPKIFFAYGFGNSVTFPLSVGASVVLLPGRPEPDAIYAAIERYRPTVFFGLPTLYNALVAHAGSEARDLSSLRLCISAAEPLPADTFAEWRRRYGLEIVEGLGSTEVLHIYLTNFPGDIRAGAAGRRVPGYEIKLLDMDDHPVAAGETGTMWVRGDSTAPFYWNQPEKTAETMRGDWVYTGDRFRLDSDGFYYFDGRADDLIKVSGQWIYPLEIERCLNEHTDVLESCVLGIAQANGLMTTKAWVALRPGAVPTADTTKILQDYVKAQLLPYKYPRLVEYLDGLPKTGTGKIDRQALKTKESTGG